MMLILLICLWANGNGLDNSGIVGMKGIDMMMILAREVIYMYHDHNIEFGWDLGTIKLKISAFQEKNDPEAYLEWKKNMKYIFF